MKVHFLYFFCLSFVSTFGQIAEEIICKTEDTYRSRSNYVDYGTFSQDIYKAPESPGTISKSLNYYLAMDREGNIYHWVNEFKHGKTQGVIFNKIAGDSLGTYQRLGNDEEPFPSNVLDAGARLVVTGGGVFILVTSLFYPDYSEASNETSSIPHSYDEIARLPDTLIDQRPCYVIETVKRHMLTQDMIDESNRRRDSILATKILPTEFKPPKSTMLPGVTTTKTKYFIHTKDYLILRVEYINYPASGTVGKRIIKLDPKFDVSDFKKHLQK